MLKAYQGVNQALIGLADWEPVHPAFQHREKMGETRVLGHVRVNHHGPVFNSAHRKVLSFRRRKRRFAALAGSGLARFGGSGGRETVAAHHNLPGHLHSLESPDVQAAGVATAPVAEHQEERSGVERETRLRGNRFNELGRPAHRRLPLIARRSNGHPR